jgi:hypothetical protein
MRQIITEATFSDHMAGDMREAFELCAGCTYLETFCTSPDGIKTEVVGRLVTFESRCMITSVEAVFAMEGGRSYMDSAIQDGDADEEFIRYDDMNAARAHAVELLASVQDEI